MSGINAIDPSGNWDLPITIDLTRRADTGKINSSPYTTIASYVKLSTGCSGLQALTIPVSDPDGDTVRCYCAGNTCLSIMTLDSNTCTITFNPSATGNYALDIVLEDFATPSSSTPLSSVPVQFLVNVSSGTTNCCKTFMISI